MIEIKEQETVTWLLTAVTLHFKTSLLRNNLFHFVVNLHDFTKTCMLRTFFSRFSHRIRITL